MSDDLKNTLTAAKEAILCCQNSIDWRSPAGRVCKEAMEKIEWQLKQEDSKLAAIGHLRDICGRLIRMQRPYAGFVDKMQARGERDTLRAMCEKLTGAIREHVECDPETYANECVGLGGADGLREALAEWERLKNNVR